MHATRGGNNDFPWAQLESIRMTPEERQLAMITYTQASRIVEQELHEFSASVASDERCTTRGPSIVRRAGAVGGASIGQLVGTRLRDD